MEEEIKKIITDLGASVCGISSVERFKDVPEGFSPTDVWSDCKSVIAFGVIYQRDLQKLNHHLYMVISIILAVQ